MKNESRKTGIAQKYLRYLVIMSLVSWSMGGAMADDPVPTPEPTPTPVVEPEAVEPEAVEPEVVPDVPGTGNKPAMDAERAKEMATTYGFSEQQILAMRQTQHMGWGEIKNMLLIAQRVSDSADPKTPITKDDALTQVLKQRESGMGIGQIADSYKLKLGDLQSADKLNKPDKAERAEKPEKPDKIARPDKPERPDKPNKPDKPEKPEKPDKPEKPGKGN